MFGLDETNSDDEGYLQFMSTLFKHDDVIRFQISFNAFKLQNFHSFVRRYLNHKAFRKKKKFK